MGSTEWNSGTFHVFNETIYDPAKATMSSGSIPLAFPQVKWQKEDWFMGDGGAMHTFNIVSAIQRCRELVDDDSKISLDVILTLSQPGSISPYPKHNLTLDLDNLRRKHTIHKNYHDARDLAEYMKGFPDVNFRYLVIRNHNDSWPHPYGEVGGLHIDPHDHDFDNASTWHNQVAGRQQGADAIKRGEGYYFKKLMHWYDNQTLNKLFPYFADYIYHEEDDSNGNGNPTLDFIQ